MITLATKTSDSARPRGRPRAGSQPSQFGGPAPALSPSPHNVIRRKAACACGGGCPRCQEEAGQIVQTKLRVGEPGDEYEGEADRVAEQLAAAHGAFDAHAASGDAHADAAHGAGRPLPDAARDFFEPRLGVNLGSVRVHTGASADASARALDARAYTAGDNVVFAAGEYAPETAEGRRLLAHELTHVAQQRAGRGPADVVRRQPSVKGFTPLDADGQKRCLEAFDRSVKEMENRVSEESLKKVTDDKLKETKSVEDMRKSAAVLKKLREGGQVICGTFDSPLKFAVYDYDGPGGKVQLRITEGVAGSTSNLMHEGIHGVHGEKYPKTAKAYSEVQSKKRQPANKTEEQNLFRYKAWTEYWGVKRAAEFDNLDPNRKPEDRVDPAKKARDKPDVKQSLMEVWKFDPDFDPEKWTPPG